MTARVLVVEDAPDALELVTAALRSGGHETAAATTAAAALESTRSREPDLILLDLGLPDGDGTDLCARLREITDVPILMLSARTDEVDKVLGLRLGADDYVTKPFSPRELLARVDAHLRRARRVAPEPAPERCLGDLVVRPDAHEVTVGGRSVTLTRIEFAILDALTENPTRVLSRETLRSRAWGEDWYAGEHALDVHMANLRRKIDSGGVAHIRTVRGVGYRMAEPAADAHADGGEVAAR